MKHLIILGAAAVLLSLGACQKDNDSVSAPYTPTKFEDLKVPASFDWKLDRRVTLQVSGLQTIPSGVVIERTLRVKGTDGLILFQALHNMADDRTLELIVPDRYTELTVEYGAIAKTVAISNGVASFDFVVDTSHLN